MVNIALCKPTCSILLALQQRLCLASLRNKAQLMPGSQPGRRLCWHKGPLSNVRTISQILELAGFGITIWISLGIAVGASASMLLRSLSKFRTPTPHFKFARSYKKTKLITVGSKSYQTPCVMCAAVVWNQPISTTAFRTAIIIVSMKQPWVIRVGESLLTINITKPKQNNRKLHHIISMRYTLYPGRPTVKPLILDAP